MFETERSKMIDDATIQRIADAVIERLEDKQQEEHPTEMKFDTARRELFHGKSREWIKYYLIHRYPEILTTHGGWLTPPAHQGVRIKVINVNQAKKWLDANGAKIDWQAPEPITLKRRAGMAKPIKRRK